MSTEEFRRKLTAILSADVKGYSLLMRDDEEATIRTLTTYRKAITNLIQQYRGRLVDATGDNLLAEFVSVVDAVNCAVEIQRELSERNAELSEDRKMRFRIGINLGDVVEEGERIYGDGVNIAARMEGLAEGGGICISGTVYDAIENKIGLEYEYMGEQEVKNIPKPIRAYRVLSYPGAAAHRVIKAKKAVSKIWRNVVMAVAAVLIVVAALAIWTFYLRPAPPVEVASVEKMAYPLPDKPSIAVLPFDNMSGDPDQNYIADGITENIISSLSKISEMFVIARNSTFTYKGKPVKIQQVAEELGVRNVLEGSVQKSGSKLRITAQLIDATTGHHLWSGRYDKDLEDLFDLQDEITKEIVVGLQVELTEGEQAQIRHRSTNNLQAWGYAIKGYSLFERYTKGDNAKARELFEKAIKLDPEYAWAWTWLAWTHWIDVRFGYSKSRAESFKRAVEIAQKAVALDETDPDVHALLGGIYLAQRQHEKALAEGKRAVDLGPNSAEVHALLGMSMLYSGEFEGGIAAAEKAMRLSPHYPSWYLLVLGAPKLFLGRYEEALEAFKRGLERSKKEGGAILIFSHLYLAATYSELGREKEARAHIEEILKINAKFSSEWVRKAAFYKNPEHLQRWLAALRKAGLPESPQLQLPDKPSIAVLPFDNLSGDPEQGYFSDGLTEEIITALSKIQRLFVIARNSTFTYKGKPVKVQQMSRELGVRYVLEGSVRRSGERVRITAQLIDATTGNHMWSERYDRKLKDIFAVQDDITKKIITSLQVKLTAGEQASAFAKGTNNLDAYLKCLQALEKILRFNIESNALGQRLAEDAIALDPKYSEPYRLLGVTHMHDALLGTSKSPKQSLAKAIEYVQKSIDLDNSNAQSHSALGFLFALTRQYDKAVAETELGVTLNPNLADAYAWLGLTLRFAGRWQEAIPIYQKAIRLNPIPPSWYLRGLALAYCWTGRYEEAIIECKKAVRDQPDSLYTRMSMAVIYGLAGREEEARAEAAEMLRIYSKFSLEKWEKRLTYKNDADKERFISALRKAGLK